MRILLIAICYGFLTTSATAAPNSRKSNHGSTAGMVNEQPNLGVGAQVGNYGGTGVSVQKVGVAGGAANFGLGLAYGSIAVSGDYLLFMGQDFKIKQLKKSGYNDFRGEVTPYFGGGAQFGLGSGLTLRFPVGVQYTMTKDPFNFFGGLALMYGRFLADEPLGIQLWVNVGARVLL